MDAASESSLILKKQALESAQYGLEISFKEFNNLLLCLVSLYLQMQLDAIKLTWKLSLAFHPVCSNIAATL